MKIRLTNLRLKLDQEENELVRLAARALGFPVKEIEAIDIVKKALDARKTDSIEFVYTVDAEVRKTKAVRFNPPFIVPVPGSMPDDLKRGRGKLLYPPVIVGSGPAGLFAALKLAEWGYRPLLLERGGDVDCRFQEIENFWRTGQLNPETNIQFGEGGAGTFSDGKLTTRVKDPRIQMILRQLVDAGAPEEIIYLNKPHIGTDLLRKVIKNIREKFQDLGGRVFFHSLVTDCQIFRNKIHEISIGEEIRLPVEVLVLAVGHSSRDTYHMLEKRGVSMEAKAFALGLRVEHPQQFIDKSQYGRFAGHEKLGAADYALAYKGPDQKRGGYSFCMCPGGMVVGAASESGGVVTNGMSEHARNSGRANSALVAAVDMTDFGEDCLAGMRYQRKWEEAAFKTGGGAYKAPAQKMEDFLADRDSGELDPDFMPSYQPGVTAANLRDCLPKEAGETLCQAINSWDRKIKGFARGKAVLTGVETRTSAPLRILRQENFESVNVEGLYPAGEGAGYAGGIMSAAVDGIKTGEAIIAKYGLPQEDFSQQMIDKLTLRRE